MNTNNKEVTTEDLVELEGLLRTYGYSAPDTVSWTVETTLSNSDLIPQDQYNVFIGIRQMIIKGCITTQELQQVGGYFPRTFDIMRCVCGVTEKKFKDLLREGKILTQLVLFSFLESLW